MLLRLKKVAALAFTHNNKGGNPVTVFLSAGRVAADRRCALAKSCEWESVVVSLSDDKPRFFFYMPSGEEVSFCAHAAIGAIVIVADEIGLKSTSGDGSCTLDFYTGENSDVQSSTLNGSNAEIEMNSCLEEDENVDSDCIAALLNEVNVHEDDLYTDDPNDMQYPTFINSSVARSKTLIAMRSISSLNSAKNPISSERFKVLCDSINSTGLYLYIMGPDSNAYECRQFPRASGYPEDPATGIAAAALAGSLHKRNICASALEIFQGTAMGKRSRIGIRFKEISKTKKGILCSGSVSILSTSEIEIG